MNYKLLKNDLKFQKMQFYDIITSNIREKRNHMKYSEIQSHRDSYPNGSYEEIVNNSKQKAFDYMREKAKDGLEYTSLSYFGNEINYSEMFKKIEMYANALKNYGIEKGDFVTLLLPNIPEIVYIKYALNRIGAIPNLIDPRTNPERIMIYTNESKSKLMITSLEVVKSKVEPIKDKLKVDDIITISAANSMKFGDTTSTKEKMMYLVLMYKELELRLKESFSSKKKYLDNAEFLRKYSKYIYSSLDTLYEENDPFTVYYTSGTTGIGKGVLQSNESYNAMVEQMTFGANASKYQKGETFLGCIPFFLSYGSLSGMHNSLCRNWNIQMVPKFDPNQFDLLIKQYKPNNVLGVPRWWETIIKNHNVDDIDFSFLRRPVTGGGKVLLESVTELNSFFKEHGSTAILKIGYGASEYGGCVASTLEDFGEYVPYSSGILLLGCFGMVIDHETEEEKEIGETGELCISSPSMMKEYLNHKKETDEITVYDKKGNKYFKTGDMGYIDEKGNVYVIDRYKRIMIRPDGHSVTSSPIEELIMQNPRVDDCVVVGLRQLGVSSTIPTAFIKLKNNNDNFEMVVDEIDEVSKVKLPERDKALAYVQTDEMKYNLLGKADYRLYEKIPFEEAETIIKDYTFFPGTKGKVLKLKK
ncbi:MAG: class I adenylate-forming enzyme family protein [bacterium]|nr:class I adenylate-forming enzyme family protein [bacterium]